VRRTSFSVAAVLCVVTASLWLTGCGDIFGSSGVEIDRAEVRLTWSDSSTRQLYLYAFNMDSDFEVTSVLMLENPDEYPQEFILPSHGWPRVAVVAYYAGGTGETRPRLRIRAWLEDDEVLDDSYTGPYLDANDRWWRAKYLRIDDENLQVRDYQGPTVAEIENLIHRARALNLTPGQWVELPPSS